MLEMEKEVKEHPFLPYSNKLESHFWAPRWKSANFMGSGQQVCGNFTWGLFGSM